ncbi:dihydropteroate synthase [Mogibacterium sp.]
MKIGNKNFDLKNDCYIMGILNFTPDSFSDGGKWNDMDSALRHVGEMIHEGAAIIDIGGESTRPGHIQITEQEEIERIVPVIKAVKERFDVPVSIDSYKGSVVEAALECGADMVNDIWGFKYDEKVAEVTANYDVPVCLMHNRNNTDYTDFVKEWLDDMRGSIDIAKAHGVSMDKIIMDPGFGFGKKPEHNFIAMHHLDKMKELELPILLGTSRKSTLGLILDLPVEERVEATVATTVYGVAKGASIFRVHDVKENYRAMKTIQAILREHI